MLREGVRMSMTSNRLKAVPIAPVEYNQLAGLLADNNLLAGDLNGENKHFYAFVDGAGWRVGVGGLEVYGDSAILRSFLTVNAHRGQGLGGHMLEELVSAARSLGIKRLFLFTQDAAGFFEKQGFKVTERLAAPLPIKASRQFAEHCSNATFMSRSIG
jgi:N-acetylglutamate synthase-like GNAT family acetyltransferase